MADCIIDDTDDERKCHPFFTHDNELLWLHVQMLSFRFIGMLRHALID